MRILKIVVAFVVFAGISSFNTAFAVTCSNTSLSGVFGFNFGGSDSSGNISTSVGQYMFDGNGNVSGALTGSRNGNIISLTFTGNYSVAKNCTGSMTLNRSDGTTEDDNFVIDNSKKGLQVIRTDSGEIKHGFAVAQGLGTCGLTGKKQIYAFNLAGTKTDNGKAAAYVGQVVVDGKGGLTGSVTIDVGGDGGTVSLTGSYTVNSDCTGTQVIQPSGLNAGNFYFVLVNSGKEMLMVQTDANNVVSGNAQQ
jgi:hypothetical protein